MAWLSNFIHASRLRQSDSVTVAVEEENLGALLALLFDGGNPNIKDEHGAPALSLACRRNDADMAHALLRAGANINECDLQGRTALYEAVSSCSSDRSSNGAGDSTALLKAAPGNKNNLVELLLDRGADPNLGNDSYRPLFAAVRTGDESLVMLLLKGGANSRPEGDGYNVLSAAVETENKRLVKLLLDHKADPNAGDPKYNPLSQAILHRKVDIVELLLACGAATERKMAGNIGPLHIAARLKDPVQPDMVEQLLRFSADVDSTDSSGRTPLFYTICSQDFDSTEMLLDSGADTEVETLEEKRRPLHEAATAGNEEIMRLLLDCSLYISPEDAHGMTPLDYAEKYGHDQIVRLLKTEMSDRTRP